MLRIVRTENDAEVQVGDKFTCLRLANDEQDDDGTVELVSIDPDGECAIVRHKGVLVKGPLHVITDHPKWLGETVALLFV